MWRSTYTVYTHRTSRSRSVSRREAVEEALEVHHDLAEHLQRADAWGQRESASRAASDRKQIRRRGRGDSRLGFDSEPMHMDGARVDIVSTGGSESSSSSRDPDDEDALGKLFGTGKGGIAGLRALASRMILVVADDAVSVLCRSTRERVCGLTGRSRRVLRTGGRGSGSRPA